MKKSTLMTILFAAFAIIFQVFETKAAPGDYDPSFGIGGVSEHQVLETDYIYMRRIALQKDGKILVAGFKSHEQTYHLFLRRHLADGALDISFGNQGEAVEFISPGVYNYVQSRLPSEIAVQPDGKILVGGQRRANNGNFLGLSVWRFTATGFLDTTFDGDGRKDIVTSTTDQGATVEVVSPTKTTAFGGEPTKILALCVFQHVAGGNVALRSAMFRLNLNGGFDTNFGSGGRLNFDGDFKDAATYKPAISIAGDLIYVAGADATGTPTIWRLTASGAPDVNFADTGKFAANIGDNMVRRFRRIIVQPDGKLLISGDDFTFFSGPRGKYILRLLTNGTPDSQFGDTLLPGSNISGAYHPGYYQDFGLQSDGKIVSGNRRYLPDGTEDTAFQVPLHSTFVVQRDDKLVSVNENADGYELRRTLPN